MTKKIILLMSLFLSLVTSAKDLVFDDDFFFGIATAPAHVEDHLDDIWADFAESGGVSAFHNYHRPYDRLKFWTQPELELDLAAELGVKVFRLGVDWERLVPDPANPVIDRDAIERYKEIFAMVRARGMKIMLTLFHHSEPRWTLEKGSWTNSKMTENFSSFSFQVLDELGPYVEYASVFNEAQLYLAFTQVAGIWPSPFRRPRPLSIFDLGPLKGSFSRSLINMSKAHHQVYDYIKKHHSHIQVGVAHNIGHHVPYNGLHGLFARIAKSRMNYYFLDLIADHLDFIGINYYGAEVVRGGGITVSDRFAYSDSGRAIDPQGLYLMIHDLNKRYNRRGRSLPFIITENGIADEADLFRASFLIEHLAAIAQLRKEGVPITGYIHWTLTDNWEWADGYCPKFGLVSIDRKNNFERRPRESFYIYQDIIRRKRVSSSMRNEAWRKVVNYYNFGVRSTCRPADDVMRGLDEPIQVPLRRVDWRFVPTK